MLQVALLDAIVPAGLAEASVQLNSWCLKNLAMLSKPSFFIMADSGNVAPPWGA